MDNNHIYYNINIIGEDKIIEFSESRITPILNKSSNYSCAVSSFNLPTTDIPIFIWDENNIFKVSITYKTFIFTNIVNFIPTQNLNNITNIYFTKAIWHYRDFIDCINATFLKCFQDFQASPIYISIPNIDRPIKPPFIIYNSKNNRCSIYFPLQYDITKTNPIYVYFNFNLFSLFPSFQNYGDENNPILSHYFIVKNNFNNLDIINSIQYLKLTEEFKTLNLWNDFKTILFDTDRIPVNSEMVSGQKNLTRKVLTDFEQITGINDQSKFIYRPHSNLRYYNLISNMELISIDLKIYWQAKNGKIYPVFLTSNDFFNIKLVFKKKGELVNSLSIF